MSNPVKDKIMLHIPLASTAADSGLTTLMENLEYLTIAIGTFGVLVIAWGVFLGIFHFLNSEVLRLRGQDVTHKRNVLRQNLGYYLLLGLEILIAADIIETIIKPELKELAILGIIIVLRTVISFSLNWELAHTEKPTSDTPKIK